MSDEEEDTNLLDINITPSEIKQLVANDLAAAKQRNDVDVEETKARISGFVNKYGEMLNCCSPQKDSEQEVGEEEFLIEPVTSQIPSASIETLMRKSLSALKEKAKIDAQVVRLMDEEEIKERKMDMEEFYKGTLKVTQKIGKTIQSQHTGTMKEIEETKKGFENTMKDLASSLPLPVPSRGNDNFFVDFVKGVAEKSAADFDETNKSSQAMAQATKTDFNNYLNEIFPSHKITLEELQSQEFIKDDLANIKDTIVRDFNRQNKSVQLSINDTKTRISQCPEGVLDAMKNFSRMSVKKIRERALGLKGNPVEGAETNEYDINEETSQSENNEMSDEPYVEGAEKEDRGG